MRLDKFLKVSRLVKRRSLAKEVCEQGRVTLNTKPAKASSMVQLGDELQIRFGQKRVSVRIDRLMETSKKDEAKMMYTLLAEERINEPTETNE